MKKANQEPPPVLVRNLQRKIALDRIALQQFAQCAVRCCVNEIGRGLTSHEEITVVLVSDRRISELHRRFMQIAGPTDVITFQHGEIVISVETAQRQAKAFGTSLAHELRLYLVHGLLHLQGFDDHAPAARRRMHGIQKRIVRLAGRDKSGAQAFK